jgi:hypothetical protein
MKTCKKCGETKTFELFSKAARAADGYNPRCKSCASAYAKILRERDPELYSAKQKVKYEKYKDVISKRAKEYRALHGAEINKRKQERIKQRLATDPEFKAQHKARKKAQYERRKDSQLARGKQQRAELTDAYVKSLMGVAPDIYVAPEEIELRRQQVIALRQLKETNTNPSILTKVCVTCNTEQPKSAFYKYGNHIHSKCKACSKVGYYKYAAENTEAVKEYRKKYYQANKDRLTAYMREYCKNNPEKVKEMGKAWRENNPDKVLQARKNYVERNRDKISERNKQRWKNLWLTNPDQIRAKKREEYVRRRDYILAYNRKIAKQAVAEISDAYVKHLLSNHVPKGMNVADIPEALIEAKRLQLKIRRMVNENNNNTTK